MAWMQPRPQIAEGAEASGDGRIWTLRLRDGLRFHDGQPVCAADCAASLRRWNGRDTFGRAYAATVDRYGTADDRTLDIRLKRPFPRLLDAIGRPHSVPAFIMPECVAAAAVDQPITGVVGSGPYRFLPGELDSGNLFAYARNEAYVPRSEAPEWASGGKMAQFDRVEWRVFTDKSTAVAALQQGEVDCLEQLPADFEPLLAHNRSVTIENADPLGTVLVMRFNHLVPPFDNTALRRFVMAAAQQSDDLPTVASPAPGASRLCRAMFPCTIPGIDEEGRDTMRTLDAAGLAAALKAIGYAGESVVVINPADSVAISPLSAVTADMLKRRRPPA